MEDKFWHSFAVWTKGLYECLREANVEDGFVDILYTFRDMVEMEPYPVPDLFVKFEQVSLSPSDFMTWFMDEMYHYADTLSNPFLISQIESYLEALSFLAIYVVRF